MQQSGTQNLLSKPTPLIGYPMNNVAPNIVYSARGDEVTDVIVNGSIVVENKTVKTLNEEEVIKDAQHAATEIANKAAQTFLNGDGWLAREVKKGHY